MSHVSLIKSGHKAIQTYYQVLQACGLRVDRCVMPAEWEQVVPSE